MGKVLVIDDSLSMRKAVEMTLRGNGIDVDTASNGQEGLNKAKAKKYDLIIVDVNMPVMDGLTFIKKVREELNPNRMTPIIFLTTEKEQSKKDEAKKAGATGWIVKPFNPDNLLSIVKRFVRN